MAVIIPDFTAYSNEDLLAIAAEQAQAYLDAYNALALIEGNPASEGVANFFDTLGAGVEIEKLVIEQQSAIDDIQTVQVQEQGLQDKFDYVF